MLKYPLRTLLRFYQLANKRHADSLVEAIYGARAAYHADDKKLKKLIREIRNG